MLPNVTSRIHTCNKTPRVHHPANLLLVQVFQLIWQVYQVLKLL